MNSYSPHTRKSYNQNLTTLSVPTIDPPRLTLPGRIENSSIEDFERIRYAENFFHLIQPDPPYSR